MKSRTVWVFTSLLIAAMLLWASCAPSAPTAPAATKAPTAPATPTSIATPASPTTTAVATTPAKPAADQPKYGGILNIIGGSQSNYSDPSDWDQAYRSGWEDWAQDFYCDKNGGQDWAKGPGGTKELKLADITWPPRKYLAGILVEDWEYPDPKTMVLHIRKGVRFHNKPPVNGREMTANDVAVSIKRMWELPTSWMYGYRGGVESVTANDKYTVTIKYTVFDVNMEKRVLDNTWTVPADLVRDASGKETEAMRNWKNVVGTGPFMLVDYVPGSSLTFNKNPDYWQRDPFRPENQLPYVDKVKVKLIPEQATRLAALRSGAVDMVRDIPGIQAESLDSSNPELLKTSNLGQGFLGFFLRNDIKPFSDKRVRQALSMAVDRDMMVKDLYKGRATRYLGYLHPYLIGMHVPEKELSAEGQANLQYNPTKAKELLAAAGYPNGFDTEILTSDAWVNEAVLVADFWKKIGVNLKIDQRETAIYMSIGLSMKFAGVYPYQHNCQSPYSVPDLMVSDYYRNYDRVNDPWWDATRAKSVSDPDETKRISLLRELGKYYAEQVFDVNLPVADVFCYWQPWLKGFYGSYEVGSYGYYRPFTYVWLDKSK